MSTEAKTAPKAQKAPPKWLITYNSISASLWSVVFFNTVFLSSVLGQPLLFEKTHLLTTVIQSFAVIEVFNAATGIVKSPLFTTTTQVLSRLLIIYGIFQLLPNSPANTHWSYITLCLAWSTTEIIRYSFYASNLADPNGVPYFLTWLRYTTFYVLYPIGVSSEVAMIYLSLDEAKAVVGDWYYYFLAFILTTYPPGLYMLYTHMIKQRKKILGGGKKNLKEKKEQ